MKIAVWRIMFFVTMISLVALSSYAGGVSVGNNQEAYISPKGFSVTYREELSLEVASAAEFRISNDQLVKDQEKASQVKFRVMDSPHKDASELRKWIAKEFPGVTFTSISLPGANGFFREAKEDSSLKSRYFLLTANGELVDITLEAFESGRGLEFVAPIVNTFAYDSTPPKIEAVWVDRTTWPAGTTQKVYFRASDENSGVNLLSAVTFLRESAQNDGHTLIGFRAQEVGTGVYAVEIEINKFISPRRYTLESLSVSDFAWNTGNKSVNENKIEVDITNSGTVDNEKPAWGGFREDKSSWKAGETRRIYFRASDAISGISTKDIRCHGMQSLFEIDGYPRSTDRCEDPRDEGDGWYSVAIKIDPFLPAGEYALYNLSIMDKAGQWLVHYTCSQPSNFYCDQKGEGTEQKLFTVWIENGDQLDITKPELLEIRFESTTWKVGERQRVYVKARDNLAGFDFSERSPRGWVLPEVKDLPGTRTIYLDEPLMPMGNDWYFMDITVGKFLREGDYYLGRFGIQDKAGNIAGVECGYEGMPKACRKSDGSLMKPVRIHVVR